MLEIMYCISGRRNLQHPHSTYFYRSNDINRISFIT